MERFDRWAATYDRSPLQRLLKPVHAGMIDLIAKERSEAPRDVIDVGCGTGLLLRTLSVRWPEAHLFGVDPAQHMIAEAKRLNAKGIFEVGTAESLPFPNESADLVLTSLSFHHWNNPQKGLSEIARVLRPAGNLCLADHTFTVARLLGARVMNSKQLWTLMSRVGFKVQQHKRVRFILVTLAEKPRPGLP